MADQHSLHDSLTDAHVPAQKSASATVFPLQESPQPQPQPFQQLERREEQKQDLPQQQHQQQHEELPQEPSRRTPQPQTQPHPNTTNEAAQPYHQTYLPTTASTSQNPITAEETADALYQAENGVEVWQPQPDDDGFDDGYGTDDSAASASLASSARDYIYENGRRYHSYRAGYYNFPNDDAEQDREDLKHGMYLKLFNGTLHFAPIETTGAIDVIDLGTGTGIWAIDFADRYPDANVLGIDLSPIQTMWVPPNLKFMVDDAESDWLHPPNHFDYVHTRHTIQAFRNWPQLYARAFEHLKPGGWIESQEIDHLPRSDDGTITRDNPMWQYWDMIMTGLDNMGVTFRLAPKLADMMRAAGFVNVTVKMYQTPIGTWPNNRVLRDAGMYWREVLMMGLEAIALGPLTRGLGWRKEEVQVFLADVRREYLKKETHAYMPFYVVYGQKPY